MNFFQTVNSQSWFRPALFALSSLATLIKTATPSHTIANKVADFTLMLIAPLAAGSLGTSNSGIPPEEKF